MRPVRPIRWSRRGLAVNCIREWRADTHWMVLGANNVSGVEAGYLHDAYLGYPGEWVAPEPRSR